MDRASNRRMPEQPRHFLADDPELSLWQQPRLLRGIMGIVGIAMTMTIFEVIFFKVVAIPNTTGAVGNQFKRPRIDNPALGSFAAALDKNIEPAIAADRRLIDAHNNYALAVMGIIVALLLGLIVTLYRDLKRINHASHSVRVFNGELSVTFISAVVTMICIGIFQLSFYRYALDFRYPGQGPKGDFELEHIVYNATRKVLGRPPIDPI